jgi:hypothetical protein
LIRNGGWIVVCVAAVGCGSSSTARSDGGGGHPAAGAGGGGDHDGGVGGAAGGLGGVAGGGTAGAVTDTRPACTAAFVQAEVDGAAPEVPDAGTCVVAPAPCRATCTLSGCNVASDVEIRCADAFAADRGLRVAPSSTSTFVAAASDNETHLLQIQGNSTGSDIGTPLWGDFVTPLFLAVDSTRGLHALGKDPRGATSHAFQTAGGTWTTEQIIAPGTNYDVSASAFEIGPDGSPHALLGVAPNLSSLAWGPGGQWTIGSPGAFQNFTLDPSGAEITFAVATIAGTPAVVAYQGGAALPGYLATKNADFRVTQALVAALGASFEPFALATYDGSAMHLAWPTSSGLYEDLVIANTPATTQTCSTTLSVANCGSSFVDKQYGLERYAFSLGRTGDGAAWLGYLATRVDRSYTYTVMTSGSAQFCACVLTDDRSTGELHLLRAAADGTQPVSALVLPLETAFVSDLDNDLPLIHVRAFGTRVAVAARVHDAWPKLRVITLETGALHN